MASWLVVQTKGIAPDGTRIISGRRLTQMQTPSSNATAHGYALGWDTENPADAPTRIEHTGNLLTYTAYQAVMPDTGGTTSPSSSTAAPDSGSAARIGDI